MALLRAVTPVLALVLVSTDTPPGGARPVGCFVGVDDPRTTQTTTGSGKDVGAAETLAWAMACTLHGLQPGCRDALKLVDRHEVVRWTSEPESGEATIAITTRKRLGGYGEGETEDAACAVAIEHACARLGKEACQSREITRWVIEPQSEAWICAVQIADERKVQRITARAPTEAEVAADLKRRSPPQARPLLAGKPASGGWALMKTTRRQSVHEDDWVEHEWVLERGAKVHFGSGAGASPAEACDNARATACKAGHVEPCATGRAIVLSEIGAPRVPPDSAP